MRERSQSVRVVIVDDSLYMRHRLRQIFENLGWDVIGEAEDGHEAVELVQSLRPDVVTMDITMPRMDGISAVRHIMQHDPKACVVMCSAVGQQDMIVQAVRAGARGFIAKPFRAERVQMAIAQALAIPA